MVARLFHIPNNPMIKLLRKILLPITAIFFTIDGYAYDVEINGICYDVVGTSVYVTYYDHYYIYSDHRTEYYNRKGTYYTGNIIIPEKIYYKGRTCIVNGIRDHAFAQCAGLTSITLPNSIEKINKSQFYGCKSLIAFNVSKDHPCIWSIDGVLFNKKTSTITL